MGLAGLDSYQDHGGRKIITSLFNFSTYPVGSLESQVGDCRSVTKERGIKYQWAASCDTTYVDLKLIKSSKLGMLYIHIYLSYQQYAT